MPKQRRIEKWLMHMARIGYRQMRSDVIDKMDEFLMKLKIPTGFHNRPGDKWYRLFMNHHPNLRVHMTAALSHQQCDVSYDNLKVLVLGAARVYG